jgi:hypothetical protein
VGLAGGAALGGVSQVEACQVRVRLGLG